MADRRQDSLLQLGRLRTGRATAISPYSPGRCTSIFAPTRRSSATWRLCRRVMRRWACEEPDRKLRQIPATGQYVSGNFFRTLGINPWIGRMMNDADDQQGAPLVAVMSYRIWKEKYGGDPTVVGAGYQINGHPFTVIGVGPPGFYGARAWRRQYARLLAPFDFGTHHRRSDGTPETARWKLSRPAGPCAARGKPDPARSQAQSGIARLAGRPRPRYAAGREATLATRTPCI